MSEDEKEQNEQTKPPLITRIKEFCYLLCNGRTKWYISMFAWPFVLLYNAIKIYFLPCILLMFGRCLVKCLDAIFMNLCPSCYQYNDREFPAEIVSLCTKENPKLVNTSEFKNLTFEEINEKIEWIRGSKLIQDTTVKKDKKGNELKPSMALFSNGIHATDVIQGGLGDCWLLASIACLAEFPGAIQSVFKTLEMNLRGKYKIELYDAREDVQRKVIITVDDKIPCYKGTNKPIFAQPEGNELWVLLLEKAFAKFCGGYSALKGGHAMWAFQAITGNDVFRLEFNTKLQCWVRWYIKYNKKQNSKKYNPKLQFSMLDSKKRYDHEAIWELLLKYDKAHALISASSSSMSGEDVNADIGVVKGHTYTLKKLKKIQNFKLIQLRNPWGTFEWKGDWSDNSDLWKQYPSIAKKCQHEVKDDGMFWIEYNDFFKLYDVIQVCNRDSQNNLHLDVREEDGYFGVAKGCCVGCAKYWCLCNGARHIYFGHKDVEAQNCCSANASGRVWNAGENKIR